MWDGILYGIVAIFTLWEIVAHFIWHNGPYGHTLSNRILWLEAKGGWPVRAFLAAAVLALGAHLEGAF